MHRLTTCKRAGWFFGLLLILVFGLLVLSSTSFAQEKGVSALASQCSACHGDLVKQFAATRHGKADVYQAWGFDQSCASCHGDAAEHMQTGDASKVVNPARLSKAAGSETCLKCHGNRPGQAFWLGSAHENSDLSCFSCHSVHKAQSPEKLLVRRTENATCFTCHASLKKAQFQRSTHLFRDEYANARLSCMDCHNPHGSQAPKMVLRDSVNETCYTCHTEKRGPFLWTHSPVQENCLTCHTAHGSNNPNLLALRTTQLCQSCHMQGRHQTVAGRPNSAWVFNRSCLNCHAQIHGSNHPSGVNLQR